MNIIEQYIEVLKHIPRVDAGKIYLNPGQIQYKKYFEDEGYEVVITDYLPSGTDMIYGNFDNMEDFYGK